MQSSHIYSIDEIQRTIAPIAQKYGVEKVYLFGSYTRMEADEISDLDFLIEKGNIRGLFALSGFRLDLEEALGKSVDIVTTSISDQKFIKKISKEAKLIYAKEQSRKKQIDSKKDRILLR